MTADPAVMTRLDELMVAIRGYEDPRRASGEWREVFRLLHKADLPWSRFAGVVGMRDVEGLAALMEQLRAPREDPALSDAPAPEAEVCKRALRAFRKRLKLTRLDEESSLGHGPLSKGGGSSAEAMTPPTEWPDAVWRELVRQGKLRYLGRGFYELVQQ